MLKFTNEAKSLLKRLEGCRLVAYADSGGHWTVGFGHTGPDVTPVTVWTQEQAELALDRDLARFIQGVTYLTAAAPPMTDEQFSALVIFAFNVGMAAFAGSTLLRIVDAGHFDAVPEQLMRWTKVHTPSGRLVVDPVLVRRREAEVRLWRSGSPLPMV